MAFSWQDTMIMRKGTPEETDEYEEFLCVFKSFTKEIFNKLRRTYTRKGEISERGWKDSYPNLPPLRAPLASYKLLFRPPSYYGCSNGKQCGSVRWKKRWLKIDMKFHSSNMDIDYYPIKFEVGDAEVDVNPDAFEFSYSNPKCAPDHVYDHIVEHMNDLVRS